MVALKQLDHFQLGVGNAIIVPPLDQVTSTSSHLALGVTNERAKQFACLHTVHIFSLQGLVQFNNFVIADEMSQIYVYSVQVILLVFFILLKLAEYCSGSPRKYPWSQCAICCLNEQHMLFVPLSISACNRSKLRCSINDILMHTRLQLSMASTNL